MKFFTKTKNQQRRGFTDDEERAKQKSFYFMFPSRGVSKSSERAFTLIETLVAVSVLLLSLAGPLTIAAQALSSAYYARDQITAFYLAQEGVEYIRAVRDENYIVGAANWLEGIDECLGQPCTVDTVNFTHALCASGVCGRVLLNENTDLFNHSSGRDTVYTRSVQLDTVAGNPKEVTITVSITWQTGTRTRTFQITEQLFDWI